MPKFTKKIEDFTCENCRFTVKGNGYTNHCPNCIYSKHVDNNPGDRKNFCLGAMKPTQILIDHGEYFILFKCLKCGAIKKNRTNKEDNFEAILTLAKNLNL